MTAAQRFKEALAAEQPLQIAGAINAYSAMLAEHSGFRAIYLSGGGVANWSYGLPDLGMTTMNDVLEDVRRITYATDVPLLVDIDTGWGSAFNIARTIKLFEGAGAACVHIEDQVAAKRCGHRPGKEIISQDEMVERVTAAADARDDMLIMARTDALAVEGLDSAVERAAACIEAGADFIFAEAMTDLAMYKRFTDLGVPVLANITEFGTTDLYTTEELAGQDVAMVLYPLSASRAMANAALDVYAAIRRDGTQKQVVDRMQTRSELYEHLGYHAYEDKLDALFGDGKGR
ncbi:2-methylisocitrate lyase [Salinisphaera orenii MK-B5]|uniref:2-methylisocitrate lyase n=1 Tax=Salinisphaera orenii MK-B5 TaxID=856730 RepID=A0A423PLL3_9GAMM|nr:methylisocitrate lyase [Salinisphaera orenii]ROO26432.1 2-methylisocitrate lyase [Salinisphaera orenii MK-B5]